MSVGNSRKRVHEIECDFDKEFIHLEIFNSIKEERLAQYIVYPK